MVDFLLKTRDLNQDGLLGPSELLSPPLPYTQVPVYTQLTPRYMFLYTVYTQVHVYTQLIPRYTFIYSLHSDRSSYTVYTQVNFYAQFLLK